MGQLSLTGSLFETPVPEATLGHKLVEVLVDVEARALDGRTFTYSIPPDWEAFVHVGTPVLVPFGRQNPLTGFVVGFRDAADAGVQPKAILDVLDDVPLFDAAYLDWLGWIANYTATPLNQVITCALPANMVQKNRRVVTLDPQVAGSLSLTAMSREMRQVVTMLQARGAGEAVGVRYVAQKTGLPLKTVNTVLYKLHQAQIVSLTQHKTAKTAAKFQTWVVLNPEADLSALTSRQQAVVQALTTPETQAHLLTEALQTAKTTRVTLQKLAELGVLQLVERAKNRDTAFTQSYGQMTGLPRPLNLNPEQQQALETVLSAPAGSDWLLYGVTGSGKTEVYMAATEAMLADGHSVMVMVPEISLTSHIAKRFLARFDAESVVIWHSQLSHGEKADAWRRMRSGEVRVVIGARSAVFAPLQNLGLVILDESHEASYKQDSPAPRYHAQSLALELAQRAGAVMLMGSATPDVESFHRLKHLGRILPLKNRFGGRQMARVGLVDMRSTPLAQKRGILSLTLVNAIQETVARGEQAILLLNRRGFYTVITCNQCDATLECPQCAVALTYHRVRERVQCHYCGFEKEPPQFCPHCASVDLTYTGLGTQRLEEELTKLLPEVRLCRMDSDMLTRKNAHKSIFEAFGQGEADVMIGTQMVAKGLDIPNVTLVGVVGADSAFVMPDFKATERGFQLLTQVAGRAGRGDKPGTVLIQTRQPEHPVILRAQAQDYDGFYEDELARRQSCGFPPFSQVFRWIVSSPDEALAHQFLALVITQLQAQATQAGYASEDLAFLGPAPCVIPKIQGRFRTHAIVKNWLGEAGHQLITRFYQQLRPPETVSCLLDVDSQSFL